MCTFPHFHCNNLPSLCRICCARCCLLVNDLRTGDWNPTGGPTNILTKTFLDSCCKWSGGMYQRWKASFEFSLMCEDVLVVPAVFWTTPPFIFFFKHRGALWTIGLAQVLTHVQLFYFHVLHCPGEANGMALDWQTNKATNTTTTKIIRKTVSTHHSILVCSICPDTAGCTSTSTVFSLRDAKTYDPSTQIWTGFKSHTCIKESDPAENLE